MSVRPFVCTKGSRGVKNDKQLEKRSNFAFSLTSTPLACLRVKGYDCQKIDSGKVTDDVGLLKGPGIEMPANNHLFIPCSTTEDADLL